MHVGTLPHRGTRYTTAVHLHTPGAPCPYPGSCEPTLAGVQEGEWERAELPIPTLLTLQLPNFPRPSVLFFPAVGPAPKPPSCMEWDLGRIGDRRLTTDLPPMPPSEPHLTLLCLPSSTDYLETISGSPFPNPFPFFHPTTGARHPPVASQ